MEDDFNIDENYIKGLSEKYQNIDHPLFMDELPKNIEENEDLLALYNLMIDDENELSLAKNFKQVGNDYYKDGSKYYEDAIISYTKGIDILINYMSNNNSDKHKNENIKAKSCNKGDRDDNQKEHSYEEAKRKVQSLSSNGIGNDKCISSEHVSTVQQEECEIKKNSCINGNNLFLNAQNELQELDENEIKNLLSDLYCNRAIVHYKKKRYVKCLCDCRKAYSYNKTKFKSIYYSILCSYHLEIYNDAYMYVKVFEDLTKEIEVKNFMNLNDYKKIKNIIFEKYDNILKKKEIYQNEKKKVEENEKNIINLIEDILKKRHIKMVQNVYNENNNISPVFYIDSCMYIHFTVFLLYFEWGIMETIIDFAENNSIMDHYDIIKKNKKNQILFCYIEFPDDVFFMIHNCSYICDVLNKIKLFSRILPIHIIENEEANRQFKNDKNISLVSV
ncbi:hypothetical protein, conserved [Plasmodium gonderi]|uniref:Tetratricopeptide repeat protein n=1 Tax=Plasmodium gonderi TaxID=77519 RepID=A0A1Y1JI55_PLAGO|nr:hypothetical protein, conserved [Plasmodium gonderi]GAW80867.1 hypothetical protein, conserved [Plasmodium gonderi]